KQRPDRSASIASGPRRPQTGCLPAKESGNEGRFGALRRFARSSKVPPAVDLRAAAARTRIPMTRGASTENPDDPKRIDADAPADVGDPSADKGRPSRGGPRIGGQAAKGSPPVVGNPPARVETAARPISPDRDDTPTPDDSPTSDATPAP